MNTYAYVNGNPLSYTDPLGLFVPQLAGGAAGAAVSGWVYWEDYKCGRISLSEYLAAIGVGGGAGAISAGASVFTGAAVAGAASATQQGITKGDVSASEVAIAAATAGLGGKIGNIASKGIFPSSYVTRYERRWYTLWLKDHKVVTEVYNEVGRDSASAVIGGTIGGGLSTLPNQPNGSNSCECSP